MLSVAPLSASKNSSIAAIENYMEGEADKGPEDYYKGESTGGKWSGGLAARMGLEGDVKHGELARALGGFDPKTGEKLANNAGADNRKLGWDATFSAPKSVSMEWALGDKDTREAIEQAQQRAVDRALQHLEQHAITNRDRQGDHAGKPGEILAATYQHGTSRDGDPQLHTHCAITNLQQRPDGTFAACDFDLREKMAAGAVYRAELANELRQMGYTIEADKDSFRIAGTDQDLEDTFSKRSQAIRAEAAATGKTSAAQLANITLDSRKAKEFTPAELRAGWETTAKEMGWKPAERQAQGEQQKPMPAPDQFIRNALGNNSTISAAELRRQAYVLAAHNGYSANQADLYLAQVTANAETVELASEKADRRGNSFESNYNIRFTSREMRDLEQAMGQRAETMAADRHSPGARAVDSKHLDAAIAAKTLSDEQRAALQHITSEGRLAVVQGSAGAGKSYMLDAARDAWERDGRTVYGCALSGKAADGLQESAKIESSTIHSMLDRIEKGQIKFDSKSVVVMDEAGMTGSRQMARLQEELDRAGGKLVLVGDVRQLQPVDAGGAMREIQGRVGAAKMDEIRRQKDPADVQMVKDFAAGNSKAALDHLESKGGLKAHDDKEAAIKAAAEGMVADLKEGKSSIALADTRADVAKLNTGAREAAKEAGIVTGKDKTFRSTDAEGNRTKLEFAQGDRILFLKNNADLGVKNGTTGTVLEAKNGKLKVRLDGDKAKEITVREGKNVEVQHGYAATVHKSQGATLDRSHYVPGNMADRELTYVASSRHREQCTMHATKDQLADRTAFEKQLATSHEKGTSADFVSRAEAQRDFETNYKPDDRDLPNYRPSEQVSDERARIRAEIKAEIEACIKSGHESSIKEINRMAENLGGLDKYIDVRAEKYYLELEAERCRAEAAAADREYERQNRHSYSY